MKKAIFFDKDGTLIENVPFNVDPNKIRFNPGAMEVISQLKDEYDFHIITNQAGVAFGHFDEKELLKVEEYLQLSFKEVGSQLSGFHYCPHHPKGIIRSYSKECGCRKPGTELIKRAAEKWSIDLSQSWLIGDILDDIEAGNVSGMKTILLDVGNETEWNLSKDRIPHFSISHLAEAITVINGVKS